MDRIDYKKSYKNKQITGLALTMVLILINTLIFTYVWIDFYIVRMRNRYSIKGNTFIILLYAILFFVLLIVFDGIASKNNKFSTSIISCCMSSLICNILFYFMIIVPVTINDNGIASMWPMAFHTLICFLVVVIWAFIVIQIMKKLYPPLPMLLITNEKNLDFLTYKFNEKKYIYNIVDSINCDKPLNEIEDKCRKYGNVVIGDIPADLRNDIMKLCFEYGINSYIIPKISDILVKKSESIHYLDTPVFLSDNEGIGVVNEIAKRFMDLIISIAVIILFSWLFIIIAILIKLEDGGTVFFIQDRVTKDEKIFKLIKFRSMVMDADKYGVRPTKDNDDRITRIGKFIRRFHIDELPQIFNVLIGDMSIVGPRPERKEHVEHYGKQISEFKFRLKVKGGITGLAQVYGKYNTTAIDKLKLDLIYIKNYSILLDIELILKTIQVIFSKEHLEGFTEKACNEINE